MIASCEVCAMMAPIDGAGPSPARACASSMKYAFVPRVMRMS